MVHPKQWVRAVDAAFFGGAARKYKKAWRQLLLEQRHSFDGGHKWVVHMRENPNDLISKLCDKYGSDKGSVAKSARRYPWQPHTYAAYYSTLFSHCRHSITRVFECGLGTNFTDIDSNMGAKGKPGASLRVWRDYFPNAEIVGADIDKRVLFQESRIKTFYVDQTDPKTIRALWRECGTAKFDLIIDDGLHTFDAGKCLFEHSIGQLAPHGIYIIEDVFPQDLVRYKDYFELTSYNVDLVSLFRPDVDLKDNSLVVIRRGS